MLHKLYRGKYVGPYDKSRGESNEQLLFDLKCVKFFNPFVALKMIDIPIVTLREHEPPFLNCCCFLKS